MYNKKKKNTDIGDYLDFFPYENIYSFNVEALILRRF